MSASNPAELLGRQARDAGGRVVGEIDGVFGDRTQGSPGFAGLTTPAGYVLIPLEGVRVGPGRDPVDLPFDGARLAGAPRAEPTVTSLDAATAQAVTAHFAGESPTQVAAPVDDDAPEMVLSEEQLLVETERVPVDRVRLRKEIVEEEVTLTVVLRREELVIEREPVGPDEALVEPVAGTETPLEIVLWAEEPVVTTRSVPTERVRLRREVVTEDREITRELKRERAEVDHPTQETSSR